MLTAYQHYIAIEHPTTPAIHYAYDQRSTHVHDLAAQAMAEMDQRRTNLGYGLGVFIGRLIGTRDADDRPTNNPIALFQWMNECYSGVKNYLQSWLQYDEALDDIPSEDIVDITPEIEFVDKKFLIGKTIAIGGTATLNYAIDTFNSETVAFKIDHYAQEAMDEVLKVESMRNQQREIAALKQFGRLRGYGMVTDEQGLHRHYIASELVQGEDLSKYLMKLEDAIRKNRNINELKKHFEQIFNIALQFCHEIQQYHDGNFIHRDIKPENMMVVQQDENIALKLVDFSGMIKVEDVFDDEDDDYGTTKYIAPELPQAKHSFVTDAYATGVSLHKMLELLRFPQFKKLRKHSQFYEDAFQRLSKTVDGLMVAEPKMRIAIPAAINILNSVECNSMPMMRV
ncbi:protein kinase domain-containing protein [Candidatus Berkiella aquae]|uniref:Protein kinase n=1 Tax=Candidatus Berkiella aquae TaxID=295108 RepID=A0A0Q9Z004_9GAMM|nr:protein kinase [Candidatus Berkiella aquae]MCS5710513.1 protein kinase [Candidatus Berkiella aquae]